MTDQHRAARTNAVQETREFLRKLGIRATPARIAVLQRLRSASRPVTHAELTDMLVPMGFDKATIFRNLADLTEAEVVHRTELGDHVWRFEAIDPREPKKAKHPHFVCVDCGGVTCLDEMEFTTRSRNRARAIKSITEILIKGHCAECEPAK
jgi:Fur family transcriptional regulator, ferric uptake regulator